MTLPRTATIPLGLVALLAAAPAFAQERHVETLSEDAQTGAEALHKTDAASGESDEEKPKPSSKPSVLVVPIPQSSPVLGPGLTLAGVMFYNPNRSSQPWITGVGAMYTKNKSWAVGAFHSMALAHDKFRIAAFAGYADVNVKFYGIGPNAGDRDVSVKLEDKGLAVLAQAQYRIVPHFYLGARYEYVDLTSSIENPSPVFPDLNLPAFELNSKISAIGPSISFDTRDNSLNPGKGMLLTGVMMLDRKSLGSDFHYEKGTLAANFYLPVLPGSTLALHGSLCGVSTGGPFYDLCMYGARSDLRGYEAGRYRDRASWTAQAEWRQHLGGKFGAVFFAGVGGIAPDIGSLDDTKFLPSAGMGLRYRASKSAGVNLSLDFAIGKDSNAIYFGIGEAF
jgi:outer membrane protein assembly factor BamA